MASDAVDAFRNFLRSESGARYIARRIRIGARHADREQRALDAWLAARAGCNHDRTAAGKERGE